MTSESRLKSDVRSLAICTIVVGLKIARLHVGELDRREQHADLHVLQPQVARRGGGEPPPPRWSGPRTKQQHPGAPRDRKDAADACGSGPPWRGPGGDPAASSCPARQRPRVPSRSPSHARAALTSAAMPTVSVGSMTGANSGEWLDGSVRTTRYLLDRRAREERRDRRRPASSRRAGRRPRWPGRRRPRCRGWRPGPRPTAQAAASAGLVRSTAAGSLTIGGDRLDVLDVGLRGRTRGRRLAAHDALDRGQDTRPHARVVGADVDAAAPRRRG